MDTEAGVPVGTASNYLTSRDELPRQIGTRLRVRPAPDPEVLTELLQRPKDRSLVTALMHDLLARATRDRTDHLALLETRLEATRRPELRASCTRSVRGDLEEAMEFHRAAGLPGGDETVTVLYLAMLGLILEHRTLPGVLDGVLPGVEIPEGLVGRIVARIVPEAQGVSGGSGPSVMRRKSHA
ncbi:TetR/AcrR family transcriptional regulator [Streptomyces sp. NPDC046197]|uniref:TetR/AcrR family transcriptional regulator n=1 Tax=Streptomyces sp. NPDC046197 TaxID=3154337 RepID=UPI0034033C9C